MNSIPPVDFSDKKRLEKYSSAFTLSDMEVFIFPDLLYPLVIANILSPVIWKWRDDPWFEGMDKKGFTYRANRIKQYIIQNYAFNLDLATWGLTTKSNELERFSEFIDLELLKQSNALFGYEGDKYYFDIDIRKHFGLDKYDSEVIPYWKTETVEAMTAFRFRENFTTGAGECVSLSALYAAALFIVGRVPLEKIFLIATPLHSQNFVTVKEGLITNNRRIVTKNMWFNGTALSEKARRALENEKVTIVSHITGHIHTLYDEATIDSKAFLSFATTLREFLVTGLTGPIFINFLRFKSKYKTHFQFECECSGKKRYISLEKLFEYEHTSKFNVSAESRANLIKEIEGDEFHLSPIAGKMLLNDAEEIIEQLKDKSLQEIENAFLEQNASIPEHLLKEMFSDISMFIKVDPKLPDTNKTYISKAVPAISSTESRESIMRTVIEASGKSEIALLSLYAYRQMDIVDWLPYLTASVERNPVCISELKGKSINDIAGILNSMPNESIYDSCRLSLPDEVWNFGRGDGIEKAILLADIILSRDKNALITIKIENEAIRLEYSDKSFRFSSQKSLNKVIHFEPGCIQCS